MTFGPFLELDLAEIHEFHRRERGYVSRPSVPYEFYRMADIVLERIQAGRISYGQFVERVQELNHSLTVVPSSDGSIPRSEIAYVLRVNHLRAVKNFEDELLYDTQPNADSDATGNRASRPSPEHFVIPLLARTERPAPLAEIQRLKVEHTPAWRLSFLLPGLAEKFFQLAKLTRGELRDGGFDLGERAHATESSTPPGAVARPRQIAWRRRWRISLPPNRKFSGTCQSFVPPTFVHGVKAPIAWCCTLRFQILFPQKAKSVS
jgi:hypothetical protein